MIDSLFEIGSVVSVLWLLLGPAVLVAISRKTRGRTKVFWVAAELAPLVLAPVGAYAYVRANPETEVHIHAQILYTPVFLTLIAVWGVYFVFKVLGPSVDA